MRFTKIIILFAFETVELYKPTLPQSGREYLTLNLNQKLRKVLLLTHNLVIAISYCFEKRTSQREMADISLQRNDVQ